MLCPFLMSLFGIIGFSVMSKNGPKLPNSGLSVLPDRYVHGHGHRAIAMDRYPQWTVNPPILPEPNFSWLLIDMKPVEQQHEAATFLRTIL